MKQTNNRSFFLLSDIPELLNLIHFYALQDVFILEKSEIPVLPFSLRALEE